MEDDKIIELFWNRAEQAIAETSKKYGNYLRVIANNILRNYEDTLECENDTYLVAWNKIPPTRPQKLLAYLGKIMRNIALDKYDYNKAKKRNSEFDLLLYELEACIPSNNNVEKLYEDKQIPIIISKFLRDIDEENRNMFIRRYWYSDSIVAIAKQYDYTESKVKTSLFRTRNKLRMVLEQEDIAI